MTLVGDRFVHDGIRWLDLVTGRAVAVRVGPAPANLSAREDACRERWGTFGAGARLLDYGPHGAWHWFEASGGTMHLPAPVRQLCWPEAADWARAIDEERSGTRLGVVLPAGAGFTVFTEQLARALRRCGFVTMRVDVGLPHRVRRLLVHRHLVLIVPSAAAAGAAAGWVAQLALVSDRRHVVVWRCDARDAAPELSTLVQPRPFSTDALLAAVGVESLSARLAALARGAAAESAGWPGRFVQAWRGAGAEVAPPVLREEAPVFGGGVAPPIEDLAIGTRDARAVRYLRRGRPGVAAAWQRASAASAARYGDVARYSDAIGSVALRLMQSGRPRRALQILARALTVVSGDRPEHPALLTLASRASLACGEVARGLSYAEAACTSEALSGRIAGASLARCDAWFFAGRWRELSDALATGRGTAVSERRQLLAWAERGEELPREWRSAAPLASRAEWRALLGAQRAIESGRAGDAAAAAAARPRRAEPGLAAAAWVRVAAAARGEDLAPPATAIERFGWVDQGGSVKAITELLEISQTAETEAAALAAVSAWLRDAAGARGAAVWATSGERLAGAAQPPAATACVRRCCEEGAPGQEVLPDGLGRVVAAPVRVGGDVIGAVSAIVAASGFGETDGSPWTAGDRARDLACAAAVVAGPFVRSRLDMLAMRANGDALANTIMGQSPVMVRLRALIARVAPVPYPALVEGESGVGKELVARALHRHGPRRDRPFAALNCAAIADELVEAELFGHARGAFTHAITARAGLFEEAHRGVLFLDEVGDLSPRAQAKLLRVLQEQEVRRVGENESRPIDVRVVAATNRPLASLAAAGAFRDDLMFRLSVVRLPVPPLRDRREDIPLLAAAFWRTAAERVGTHARLAPDVIGALVARDWPGNVRELQNVMAALAIAAPRRGVVRARLLAEATRPASAEVVPLAEARRAVERRLVAAALAQHAGRRTEAARALGVSRQGLAKLMRRLGLAEAGAA